MTDFVSSSPLDLSSFRSGAPKNDGFSFQSLRDIKSQYETKLHQAEEKMQDAKSEMAFPGFPRILAKKVTNRVTDTIDLLKNSHQTKRTSQSKSTMDKIITAKQED